MALSSTDLGLLLGAAGTSAAGPSPTTQQLAAALRKALVSSFPTFHPGLVLPAGNTGFGYYAPYVPSLPPTLPRTLVLQVHVSLQDWGLVAAGAGKALAKQVARAVVLDLAARGGQAGRSVGTAADGTGWVCYAGLGTEGHVAYAFAAAGPRS